MAEVSSFQLEWVRDFRPRVALFLNLSEDHLDRYDGLSSYGAAKARIFAAQRSGDVAVLNRDDPWVWGLRHELAARVVSFGWSEVEEGAFATEDAVVWRGDGAEERFPLRDVRLRGVHNVENVMAAVCAAKAVGVEAGHIRAAARRFPGIEHRLEFVREVGGARYFNDSKGTNVGAVRKSLASFDDPIVLIAGGVHKGGGYRDLEPLVRERVRKLILLGEAAGLMKEALGTLDRHLGGEGPPGSGGGGAGRRPRRRRGAAVAGVLELRHVRELRRARARVQGDGAGAMSAIRNVDRWMLVSLMALLAIGVTMVLNTSYLFSHERFGDGTYLFRKQLAAAGLGLLGLYLALLLPPSIWRRLALPSLVLAFAALVLVLVPEIGVVRGGAQRWLGVPPFVFQPSEPAKVGFVLYLAWALSRRTDRLDGFLSGVLPPLLVTGVFVGLLLAEPDFGSAFILAVVAMAMLFVAGGRVKHLAGVAAAALPAAAFLIMSADYRVKRLLAFMDPWSDSANSGFQIIQSYIAFGSGQLWGRGLGQSRQKLLYLPEAHTDFIYSVIGEELGLWGALLVVGLFGVLLFRGMRLALEREDLFTRLMVFGLTLLLGLQALVHMSVVMGLVPTKGLVLPFVSYGGSALVVHLTVAGMLLGVSRRRAEPCD